MLPVGYDIIGDIHGHADALELLLTKLDYVKRGGVWRHSERMALFVGDFVDRGSENIRTCRVVMDMIGTGAALAVMGNHEFNHVALDTPDLDRPGEFLRPRSEKNLRQGGATLAEFRSNPDDARSILHWMRNLPLWITLDGLRLIHAAWNADAIKTLAPHLDSERQLSPEGFVRAARKGDALHVAREWLLGGPEVDLPNGIQFTDHDGHERNRARLAWWHDAKDGVSWSRGVHVPPGVADKLPCEQMPAGVTWAIDDDRRPIFFGHYWMSQPLSVLSSGRVCVDASVAQRGKLAAYRFGGEEELTADHFVYV